MLAMSIYTAVALPCALAMQCILECGVASVVYYGHAVYEAVETRYDFDGLD